MELKQIAPEATEFEAMGVKYYVKSSLTVERFRIFEKLQVEFGFGRTFKEVYDMIDKSVGLANKGKGIEAWNILFNLREGVGKSLEKSAHPAMLICTLFLVTEDEDLTKWDEQIASKKVDNWNSEGYDVNSFFRLAANLVTGYIETLDAIFQNTSELAALTEQMEELNELKQQD